MINLLKRFEIWLLVALVVAAIWWALAADPNPISSGAARIAEDPSVDPINVEENQAILEIKAIKFTPEQGGGIVEVTLLGKSGTDAKVSLNEKTVEMLSSEGDVIRRFFTPFTIDPQLEPDEATLVTLRYWLIDPLETLWLTYRDQTFKVELPSA